MTDKPKILLTTCGSWHLPDTARSFHARNALAGLWITGKNRTGLPGDKYRRCWPFHMAMKPFYHLASPLWTERTFYALSFIWRDWFNFQFWPECNVVQSIMGFCTEPFDKADKNNALKVLDAPNSHPITYYGIPQSEYDVWQPGSKVGIPRWMFARMNRELKRADVVLCPSNFVRDTMVEFGVPAEKCFINPYGVDTSVFSARPAVPEVPRFIIVGNIGLRKGHHYLFEALREVKRNVTNAELVCVGECLENFREEWKRWKGVFTHHPRLSHKELAKLFQQCTAFVFPSLEEGFARVITEAMAAGLPIIASHQSGATTLVQDGVEGIIVPPRETHRIAEAMIRLARDRDLNRKMGEAAWRRGAQNNSWQDYGDRLLAEYSRRLQTKISAEATKPGTGVLQ